VWTSLESFALSGLSLISLLIFTRLLSPHDFGIIAVALAIVQVLNVPVELLFHDVLIQRDELTAKHVNSAFTVSVVLGCGACAITWLSAGAIEALLHEPGLAPVLRYMSLSLPAMGFASVLVATQRRHMQFRWLALRSLVGRAGSAIIAILLAFLGAGLWSLVAQQVLLVALSTLVLWITADDRPSFQFAGKETRELLGFGVLTTATQLSAMMMQRVFMVMVGGFLGSDDAGRLSVAFRGLDMLRDLLAGAVSQVAMPVFSRLQNALHTLVQAYSRAVELTTLVAFPIFLGLSVCAADVVRIAFGERWVSATPYFAVVALLTIPFFTRMYAPSLLKSLGHPSAPTLQFLAETAFVVGAMLAFGRHSLTTAMTVWVARFAIGLPLDLWFLRRYSGMHVVDQLRGAAAPALAGIMMAGGVAALSGLLSSAPPVLRLVCGVVSGAVIYAAVLWIVGSRLLMRLFEMFGQALRARRS
jgi:PST family polysaccharide transporter